MKKRIDGFLKYSRDRIWSCFCIKEKTIQTDDADNYGMQVWTNPVRHEDYYCNQLLA